MKTSFVKKNELLKVVISEYKFVWFCRANIRDKMPSKSDDWFMVKKSSFIMSITEIKNQSNQIKVEALSPFGLCWFFEDALVKNATLFMI